jgi:hypothetical protein
MKRGDDVVEIIFERIADRLSHVGKRSKVHHHLDFFVLEDFSDRSLVAQIRLVKTNGRAQSGAVPEHQVVQYHRVMSGGDQLPHTVTANVARPADNKNVHRILER